MTFIFVYSNERPLWNHAVKIENSLLALKKYNLHMMVLLFIFYLISSSSNSIEIKK